MTRATATALVFPAHWSQDSREVYQRLADIGRVTQTDVDEAELHLVWWREWRDYYATTAGQDEIVELARGA